MTSEGTSKTHAPKWLTRSLSAIFFLAGIFFLATAMYAAVYPYLPHPPPPSMPIGGNFRLIEGLIGFARVGFLCVTIAFALIRRYRAAACCAFLTVVIFLMFHFAIGQVPG